MSVAIAAPQAKLPVAPSNSDKAAPADKPADGSDFASLLQGKLTISTERQPALPEDALLAALPEDTLIPTDASITTIAELVPQDTAALLAALGIIQPAQAMPAQAGKQDLSRISDEIASALPGKTEGTLLPLATESTAKITASNELAIGPETSSGAKPGDFSNELASAQEASSSTKLGDAINELATGQEAEAKPGAKPGDAIPPAAYGADEHAAKIAVADLSLPKAEVPLASSLSNESSAVGTTGVSAHAPATIQRNAEVLKLDTPVRDQSWATDFNQKIVWMASNDKQVAQLTLNPPQMGPIEISLNLNKDGASAMFVSQNAEVREAIETALPRLREMLASAGIELGQANVSAESFRQQAGGEDARQSTPRWAGDNAILDDGSELLLSGQAIIPQQRGNGLVNTFA